MSYEFTITRHDPSVFSRDQLDKGQTAPESLNKVEF